MKRFEQGIGFLVIVLMAAILAPATFAAEDGGMLYLVEFEATESGMPTTREQAIELLDQLIVPSLKRLANEGRIHAGGVFAGGRAGAFIVAAKSHDEVTELVRALPAWGVWGWQVRPLESFTHRAELETKVLQGLRAK